MRIRDVKPVVTQILEEYPLARGNNDYLYYIVCATFNPVIKGFSFEDAFKNMETFNVPGYETVTRTRRKVQAEREDLRPTDRVTEHRFNKWKEVIEDVT